MKNNKEIGKSQPGSENILDQAAESPSTPIHNAIDAVNIASVARSFIHDNIAPVMAAIATLSDFDSLDVGQNRQRLRLIKRLARLGGELVTDAVTCMESEQDDAQAKLTLLEGSPK